MQTQEKHWIARKTKSTQLWAKLLNGNSCVSRSTAVINAHSCKMADAVSLWHFECLYHSGEWSLFLQWIGIDNNKKNEEKNKTLRTGWNEYLNNHCYQTDDVQMSWMNISMNSKTHIKCNRFVDTWNRMNCVSKFEYFVYFKNGLISHCIFTISAIWCNCSYEVYFVDLYNRMIVYF